MKHNLINRALLISFIFIISSCSSMDSLKFWQSDEVDIDEPKKLENFTDNISINVNWKISFNGNNSLGNFIPSYSGNNIFFADTSGKISSIDSSSGKVNWEIETVLLASGISSGFGILVVGDVDGNVIARDQDNGSLLWTTNVKGEVLSATAIDTKLVIVKTGSGELIALDRNSGETKWSYRSKLPTLTIRGSSSPVIVENKVYASFDNGRLGVFELDTGFPIWDGAISYMSGTSELENLVDSDSSPLIDGGFVYSSNYQGNLNIFDTAQKRSVWQYESSSFYTPLVIKGLLVTLEDNSNIRSFSLKNLNESWASEEYLNRGLSNLISQNSYIVVGDFEGHIHIIDPLNGKTVGREKISRNAIKTITGRSNTFYVVDEEFNLFSLSI
jgi:outer membrane protein assembly factor BamB